MSEPTIEHPNLVDALIRLAEALDDRRAGERATTYLEMAVVADSIRQRINELTRQLVLAARDDERASWSDVGAAFGVTRQAAMRRWSDRADT